MRRLWGKFATEGISGKWHLEKMPSLLWSPSFIQSNSALLLITCWLLVCFLQWATSLIPWNSEVSMPVWFGKDKRRHRKFAMHSVPEIQIYKQILQKRTMAKKKRDKVRKRYCSPAFRQDLASSKLAKPNHLLCLLKSNMKDLQISTLKERSVRSYLYLLAVARAHWQSPSSHDEVWHCMWC